MSTGYSTQLTRQIGEHLVVAKLGRFGIIATPFAGNVPDYDLLASDLSGHSRPIQVKAINGPSWQFNAASFLEIAFDGNRQIVRGKKELTNPELLLVFVFLKADEKDVFYILTKSVLQEQISKGYGPERVRPRNPKSTHCAIWPDELEEHRDKWKLITDCFDAII